jgi:threonine dehydrogenase-like Zn-dependent dehydrogenase
MIFSKSVLLSSLLLAASAQAQVTTQAVFSEPNPGHTRAGVGYGDWNLPSHPENGSVRVKMEAAQICNSDRRVLGGTKKAEVLNRSMVLGHEGVGRLIELTPAAESFGLKLGQYVVVLPHFVRSDDPFEKKGVPNLSPDMKHLGFHRDGVFADVMDFPAYSIFKLPDADKWIAKHGRRRYGIQMVNSEPLACIHRSYNLLDQRAQSHRKPGARILILGGGPMGVMHALHAQTKYPHAEILIYDTNAERRRLAENAVGVGRVLQNTRNIRSEFDLIVTATSDWNANTTDAFRFVANRGSILLFSGIDMLSDGPRPIVGGIDIEKVHRGEGQLKIHRDGKEVLLVGSSGYTKSEIASSVAELYADLDGERRYERVATKILNGLQEFSGKRNRAYFDARYMGNYRQLKIAVSFAVGRCEALLK